MYISIHTYIFTYLDITNTLGDVQYTETKKFENPPLTDTNTYTTKRTELTDCTHEHRHIHED